jgi:hypothetical protein
VDGAGTVKEPQQEREEAKENAAAKGVKENAAAKGI